MNEPPWIFRFLGTYFGGMTFNIFCKLGLCFYGRLAFASDGKAAFFGINEDEMVVGMLRYMEETDDQDAKLRALFTQYLERKSNGLK